MNLMIIDGKQDDGSSLDAFLAGETWDQYLLRMGRDGEWGDHMILNAIAEVLRMNIVIYGGIADQRKTTIVPKSCTDQAIRGDVRIGHLIESHYISLRKKDWMEILDTHHGNDHKHSLETSGNASFPLNHLDMIMKLVIQCEYVQSLTPNQARLFKPSSARGKEETIQIVGDFLLEAIPTPYSGPTLESVPLSNAFSHESNVTLIPVFYSPHDTIARFENDQAAPKDVVISGNPSEGPIKLIPIKPSLWKGLVHYSNGISYLKTFELSVDLIPVILKETLLYGAKTIGLDVKCIISFWCEWPISALEWVSRNRPGMFPAYDLVHSLFNGGCDVVPCFCQTEYGDVIDDCTNVSDANTPIHWCLSFAVPERSLFRNLSMQQHSCFLIYRAMVEQSITGHVLPSSIVKSLFLYACENIPQNDWESKPGHCLLLLLRNTFNAFSRRFLAHYFICSKNLLRCLSESVLLECASELQKCWSRPIAALNHALETLNVASSEIGPVLDQIIADMNEFVVDGNAKKSFVNCLYPSSGYIMQSMIINGEYEKALTTIQDIQTQFENVFSKQINVEQIIVSVLSRTNMCSQWTFALFMDIRLGTQISAAICQGLPKIHISEVFGPKATELLADTVMPESASIEHGDLTYAGTVMEILQKLKKDDAMIVVIKYYLETYSRLAGDSLVIPVRDEAARNGIISANSGMVKLVGSKAAVTEYELSSALPSYLNYLHGSLFNTCKPLGKIEEYRSVFPAYRALATLVMSETFTRNVRVIESCLGGGGSSSESILNELMSSMHPSSRQDDHDAFEAFGENF
ncbi:hypothetical protein DPMN_075812 [Dreissena polymorpha]|uniref:Mab-21-like HhH/H2TH-like domain-containing protein n=1 Tax=Dreissena polymorpha TaxID=45954 RepID=A0A9D4BN14_DREPO|nr:hypothetical protein DPMN_075812 [Dreissena polymorpha]